MIFFLKTCAKVWFELTRQLVKIARRHSLTITPRPSAMYECIQGSICSVSRNEKLHNFCQLLIKFESAQRNIF